MPRRPDTVDHHFWIPKPWKETAYAINWDEMRYGRKWLLIAWYREFGGFFLRIGWVFVADPVKVNESVSQNP